MPKPSKVLAILTRFGGAGPAFCGGSEAAHVRVRGDVQTRGRGAGRSAWKRQRRSAACRLISRYEPESKGQPTAATKGSPPKACAPNIRDTPRATKSSHSSSLKLAAISQGTSRVDEDLDARPSQEAARGTSGRRSPRRSRPALDGSNSYKGTEPPGRESRGGGLAGITPSPIDRRLRSC
jgi:hypothetical protein